jgi:hypothetical protein
MKDKYFSLFISFQPGNEIPPRDVGTGSDGGLATGPGLVANPGSTSAPSVPCREIARQGAANTVHFMQAFRIGFVNFVAALMLSHGQKF